jgi:AraC-like DNA-binding protein
MVATEFNVSEGYVSTLFKDQVGVNFSDYVEKLRMEEACNQLQESQISISQIAEEVGYNSIQSFRRAFKKVKGVSPSKFREDGIL